MIEAENGRIRLEIAEAQIPDLIISDVMMPEMDGYQLRRAKIRRKTNHIPEYFADRKSGNGR
ncbi:MAG: response regulator [Calditrichia bacterium]